MVGLGLALVLAGATIMVFSLTPKPTPPVDILMGQSEIVIENNVYFDSILIHNHGSSNVTVVVEIETSLDTKPRLSDPVTLCAGCSASVLIEEVQPPPGQIVDQSYINLLTNPQLIRVDYLSTVLVSRFDDYWRGGGAGIIVVGLFILVRNRPVKRTRRQSRA
jgi:hypothetical protein